MRYDKDHKPTGDAAKKARLPEGFRIAGAINRPGGKPFVAGDEAAYAATEPSAADVERLTASGALVFPDADAKADSKADAKAKK